MHIEAPSGKHITRELRGHTLAEEVCDACFDSCTRHLKDLNDLARRGLNPKPLAAEPLNPKPLAVDSS